VHTPKIVRSFQLRHEAEFAAATLDDAGIPAIVSGGDLGGADPSLGIALGIKVLVDAPQWEAADELLKALNMPHDAAPLARLRPRGKRSQKTSALGGLVAISWAAAAVVLFVARRGEGDLAWLQIGALLAFFAVLLTVWHVWRQRPRPGSYARLDEP
jgi:hypothetical protein